MLFKTLACIPLICLPIVLALLLASVVLVERKRVSAAGKTLVIAGAIFVLAVGCAITLAVLAIWGS